MRRLSPLLALWFAGCSALGSGDPELGGDPDADADAGADGWGQGCAEPDSDCPEEHPQPGGPCEGALECEYTADEPEATWTYRCLEGVWEPMYSCPTEGCWAPPPLAEFCLEPFEGELVGASVQIGPGSVTGPFRPFSEGERVELIVGPQGSAMIPYRVNVGDVQSPDCLILSTTLSVSDQTSDTASNRLRMRCGQSLTVFVVFPFDQMLCSAGETIEARLHVLALGLGEDEATVRFEAPGCPK